MELVKVKTEINPGFLNEFASQNKIATILEDAGVDKFNVIENHRSAYGISAYQILEVSETDAEKLKLEIEAKMM